MSERRRIRDALAAQYDDYEVRERLHDVPPHVTYEVRVDGTRAVCKLATGPEADPATEGRTMEYVAAHTAVPVPEVLAVGDDHFVARWHPDVPDGADKVGLDAAKARAMGAAMATLHEGTAGAFDGSGLLGTDDGDLTVAARDAWRAAVQDRLADHRPYLDGVGHADVADAVLDFLRAHPDAFAGAGDPVLCHGNVLPAHVGVCDGDATCVIDFEHALVGPPEYDCWRTLLPLRANEDWDAEAPFREGYETVRPLPGGVGSRERLYGVVNTVSYLRSLHLQGNVTGEEAARRADWMREYVFETLDELEREFADGVRPRRP